MTIISRELRELVDSGQETRAEAHAAVAESKAELARTRSARRTRLEMELEVRRGGQR
jgi:hypothetical protein